KTFNSEVPKFFNSFDQPILQEIKFNVKNKDYIIDYKNDDKENRNRLLDPFMEVIDCGPISHHAYHYEISNTATRINQEISNKISIFTLNIENMPLENSNVDIDTVDTDDQEVEGEALKYISKACYRCITDILMFIIPSLIGRGILNTNNSVINIRISGNGCNVSRTIKHMMITCTILDDILNIHKADFHYTLILYLGIENYEILKNVMDPFIIELNNLTTNRLDLMPQIPKTSALGAAAPKKILEIRTT
ncbi:12506_t:CDS:2, partial [Gigaspora margarita]